MGVGEPRGFREFVASHSRALLRCAWLLCGDWATAEDLVQETLVRVLPRWETIRDPEAAFAYTRRTMVTTYIGWQRRRSSTEVIVDHVGEHAAAGDPYLVADTRESLQAGLARLTPAQRATLVLRYFLDLSEAQTARELGCTVGTVKSNTSRGIERLRAQPGLADLLREGAVR
jgi:RNA polymerase sigma-70 factor (sigma-E family)